VLRARFAGRVVESWKGEGIETVLFRVGVGSLRVFVLSACSRFFLAVFCFLPYFIVWWKIIDRRRSARSPYSEGSDTRPDVAPVNQTAVAPHSNMHIAHRKQHGLAEGRPRSKRGVIMKGSRRMPNVAADPARGSRSKPRVSGGRGSASLGRSSALNVPWRCSGKYGFGVELVVLVFGFAPGECLMSLAWLGFVRTTRMSSSTRCYERLCVRGIFMRDPHCQRWCF
jgi:hypothetical protein